MARKGNIPALVAVLRNCAVYGRGSTFEVSEDSVVRANIQEGMVS